MTGIATWTPISGIRYSAQRLKALGYHISHSSMLVRKECRSIRTCSTLTCSSELYDSATALVMKAMKDSTDRCALVPAYVRHRTVRNTLHASNLVLTSLNNDQGSRSGCTSREDPHCYSIGRVSLVLSRVWNLVPERSIVIWGEESRAALAMSKATPTSLHHRT